MCESRYSWCVWYNGGCDSVCVALFMVGVSMHKHYVFYSIIKGWFFLIVMFVDVYGCQQFVCVMVVRMRRRVFVCCIRENVLVLYESQTWFCCCVVEGWVLEPRLCVDVKKRCCSLCLFVLCLVFVVCFIILLWLCLIIHKKKEWFVLDILVSMIVSLCISIFIDMFLTFLVVVHELNVLMLVGVYRSLVLRGSSMGFHVLCCSFIISCFSC